MGVKKVLYFFIIISLCLFPNNLSLEESPYLQQHSDNPVKWFAWSKEAFEKAKEEDKLIFLSIGYSSCHWCHIMEKESFEDNEIAEILNKDFISIKVDREEYPQIDRYYQMVHQILSGSNGGWPLTIILTPDKKPLLTFTYLPKDTVGNQYGLKDTLEYVAKEWNSYRRKLKDIAYKIQNYIDEVQNRNLDITPEKPVDNISNLFVDKLLNYFDREFGGWGERIKFPQASKLLTLLDIYSITKNSKALNMATKTLDKMALSGIFDQVDGGFFRYSTDVGWRIPHFEKMLYTNAELIEVYTRAYLITRKELYRRVVEDTIKLFLDKYRDKSGLFYGASDADGFDSKVKKREEGYYFVYSYDEVKKFLENQGVDKKIIKKGLRYYGITESGNFINCKTNPYLKDSDNKYKFVKRALKEIREEREYPFIDKKMQTSWNSLMISALFKASQINPKYAIIAQNTLEQLIAQLYLNGTLFHQVLPNRTPKVEAELEDYIFVVEALLDGYHYNLDENYLIVAKELQERAKGLFFKDGVWIDDEKFFSTPVSIEDGAYRSTLAVLIQNYLRLAILYESREYFNEAKREIYKFSGNIREFPAGYSTAVRAILAYKYGYFLLKAEFDQLEILQERVEDTIIYPFIEYKASKDKEAGIQACKIDKCLIFERNIDDFLQKLERKLYYKK